MEEESMTSKYFQSMYGQLSAMVVGTRVDRYRVELLQMDAEILKAFCMCIETRNHTTADEENEESIERLRSVITPLKVVWPKYFTDSVMSEFEARIRQTKQQVACWYSNSIHSSMQCKSTKFSQISDFLILLEQNLILFDRFRARKIVPLKKQIDILRAKIEFLKGNLINLRNCPDGKEILQFMNFIGHFANSVACLTCFYWAKEHNHEIASEMNIVLFDMLQKFIPYAFDITLLYVGFLKSDDLQLVSDSFLLEEAVKSFVDFFFEHLATVLKDGFLFLRDRLMFLFTFLTDPPCENAEEGGDLIRSQIYAILHEDVYLLLSFDEMNKDFSDKKALLSGCMTRIDIANANIRQLYRGSSDSWITLEVENMEHNYFVSLYRELSWIEKHAEGADMEQLQLYRMELRFLRVFFLRLATWDDTDEEIKLKLSSVITSFQGIWGEKEEKGLLAHRFHAIRRGSITDWHPLAFELQGKIQQSKLETKAWCVYPFHSSFQFKTSTSNKILKFLDSILDNLNDLVSYKSSEIIPFKKQIETLKEKLIFLKMFLKLAMNCKYNELGEVKMFVQAFANDAACLTFLYWEKDANASETNSILSHMLQKIKPATPNVARLYFGTLMAKNVQRSDSRMFGQIAFSFVELFLEDLATHLKDVDFQILQDNMVFLLTFLNDPSNQNAEQLICSRIDVLFWEGLYGLIPFDDMEGVYSNKEVLLSEFITKIEAINANIRRIYGKFPDSSLYNFPKVISPQFLDSLMQNLRNLKERMNSDPKYVAFAKYKIIKIEEELASLCPFFIHIFGLQSELKETWLEVVNVLHLTEHVIMSSISSLFVFDHPLWYHMAYLSNVFDEIKLVKAKLEKIKLENILKNETGLANSSGFTRELAGQHSPSEINEIVVGFEHEAEEIIGMLTRGTESLDVVSVVGMGGLGKTTLAKKVYASSSVKSTFQLFAFCFVSQNNNTRRLLLDILRDVGVDNITHDMTNDDLAHKLKQRLSHQKYLIVLDDIWDLSAWNKVKSSLPDNKNKSRVMFTTRSREVADQCRINCSPHQLRFLSEDESWELLQNKVFRNGISPPYLYEIGKQIAKNCKGLALAVAVIAGLLTRTEKSLRWWSEVEQRLAYYLSNEGCMEILELSYKHLPENLKPCLMYFGAFPEDMPISVKRVIMLWIAEGFIQESKTKSLEDVANEYFQTLVDRSFIIVNKRSSSGGIKNFHVHDLIHELCQKKCRDGNFFQLNHDIASSSSSNPLINNHYRVSIQKERDVGIIDIVAGSSLSNIRSLHIFCEDFDYDEFPLWKLGLVQMLDLGDLTHKGNDINQLTSLIHLRYIDATFDMFGGDSIPSSISNLWNITSLTLTLNEYGRDTNHLPYTFWRMKSLRYVKVVHCILKFSDDDDEHEAYLPSDQIMDKVVSFSKPILSTGKDVERLLRRLPVVRKLSCVLKKSRVDDEASIETLDFHRELESLTLRGNHQYMINFPSTLRKLTLESFRLPSTALSAIAELHCLEVLKLIYNSFGEQNKLETEDLVFRNLKFFLLIDDCLEEWNASTESFPCLEQLVIRCSRLEELPPCFGEMSTLKKIVVLDNWSWKVEKSALRIQEELMELGIQLELRILAN